jgi:hypothetical protein
MADLKDFIMVTGPLLEPLACKEILATTEGIEWRIPYSSPDYPLRTCTTFPISAAVTGNFPYPVDRLPMIRRADAILLETAMRALSLYKSKFPLSTRSDSGFDILRYETGQCISQHRDDMVPRVLSMSVALNDDYTGGEFKFWDDIPFRLPGGCVLMFPPQFMYPHQVLPVTGGTRYSMITWFL